MLVAARDKDAFKTLQAALTIMEQEMLTAPDKSESSTSSACSTRSSSNGSITSSDRRSSSASSASEDTATSSYGNAARFVIDTKFSTEIPELKDDRYFIFNQALLVETEDNITTGSTQDSASAAMSTNDDSPPPYSQSLVCFYTSVVIYNLALAYHKRGMSAAVPPCSAQGASNNSGVHMQDRSRLALSQSLRLYEHCLKIVRSIANYSEDCQMLLYAVSCNLAHLYCRKGDRSRAHELLEALR